MKDSLLLFGFTWKGTLLQVKLSETCVPGVWHVWNKLLCFNLTSFFAVAEQHIHFLFIPAATRKRRLCLLQLHESWFSCCLAWCVCKALQRWVQLATRHILLLLFPWFYCMPQYIFKKWGWWVSLDLSIFVCISFLSGRKVFTSSIPYSDHGSIIM